MDTRAYLSDKIFVAIFLNERLFGSPGHFLNNPAREFEMPRKPKTSKRKNTSLFSQTLFNQPTPTMPKTTGPPSNQPITLTSAAAIHFQAQHPDSQNVHRHHFAQNPTPSSDGDGRRQALSPEERRRTLVTLINSLVADIDEDMEE
jgi:hypothetical protein